MLIKGASEELSRIARNLVTLGVGFKYDPVSSVIETEKVIEGSVEHEHIISTIPKEYYVEITVKS